MQKNSVFLLLTTKCNQRCKFCYTRGTVTENSDSFITEEDFKIALNWISEYYNPESTIIRLTGGEPTLHNRLPEFIKQISKKDFPISLITNGSRFREVFQEVRDFNVRVQFSLEGIGELHDRIVGKKGSFKNLIASIELALREDINMHTNTTLSRLNRKQIFDIFRFLSKLGVGVASLNYVTPTKFNRNIMLDFYEISEVYRKVKLLAGCLEMSISTLMAIPMCISDQGSGCAVGIGDVTITPELKAYCCPAITFPDTQLGDIRKNSIEELFDSWIYRSISQTFEHLPEVCRNCRFVQQCKGGCYLFWRHGLMQDYELSEKNVKVGGG